MSVDTNFNCCGFLARPEIADVLLYMEKTIFENIFHDFSWIEDFEISKNLHDYFNSDL